MEQRRIFKLRRFDRFARREGISDAALKDAVQRAERGQIDADLGGGVIKQRIARQGQGRSGGYRTIILFRRREHVFFLHGFAKSDQENIGALELDRLKLSAKGYLMLSPVRLADLVENGDLVEVKGNGQEV
jgi:hypothetical protein